MKTLVIISVLFLGLGLQSCQSEYSERMNKALKLKYEYHKVKTLMSNSQNPVFKIQLGEIEEQIEFHAKLSGNAALFMKELWRN